MGTCSCCQKTIKDGEAYAITEMSGVVEVVEGPTRACTFCCGRTFEKLNIRVAKDSQYLSIKHRDGRTEIRQGPTAEVVHPVNHVQVEVEDAIQLIEQETLVVYRRDNESGVTKRELVDGPCLYMPKSSSEWIHQFQWTGNDPSCDSRGEAKKKVGALKFTKLRKIPAQMYFDVENVRTKDNALITVKLVLFYQLKNVDKMLDTTNDPMGDFVNAVSADVIEWCAPKKFDDFLAATDQLNTLEPYSQLRTSAGNVGYNIERVVFRGYLAPQALQKMHDSAIERRTALSLQKETETEEQNMADFKLQKESERTAQQQKLDLSNMQHEINMKKQKADAENALKKEEAKLELERLVNIKKLDKSGEMAQYLMAKDCTLPTVVNCQTMMPGSNLPGLR